jgi:hypothetical protein
MKPTSKTPYEIRLELLQLAFEVLNTQHVVKGVHEGTSGKQITFATTEEIIAEAEKLNGFISKANSPHI